MSSTRRTRRRATVDNSYSDSDNSLISDISDVESINLGSARKRRATKANRTSTTNNNDDTTATTTTYSSSSSQPINTDDYNHINPSYITTRRSTRISSSNTSNDTPTRSLFNDNDTFDSTLSQINEENNIDDDYDDLTAQRTIQSTPHIRTKSYTSTDNHSTGGYALARTPGEVDAINDAEVYETDACDIHHQDNHTCEHHNHSHNHYTSYLLQQYDKVKRRFSLSPQQSSVTKKNNNNNQEQQNTQSYSASISQIQDTVNDKLSSSNKPLSLLKYLLPVLLSILLLYTTSEHFDTTSPDTLLGNVKHTLQTDYNDTVNFINGGYKQYSPIQHAKRVINNRLHRFDYIRNKLHSTQDIYSYMCDSIRSYLPDNIPNIADILRNNQQYSNIQGLDTNDWNKIQQYIQKQLDSKQHQSSQNIDSKSFNNAIDKITKQINEQQKQSLHDAIEQLQNKINKQLTDLTQQDKQDEQKLRNALYSQIMNEIQKLINEQQEQTTINVNQLVSKHLSDAEHIWRDTVHTSITHDINQNNKLLTDEMVKLIRGELIESVGRVQTNLEQQINNINNKLQQLTTQHTQTSQQSIDSLTNQLKDQYVTKQEFNILEHKLNDLIQDFNHNIATNKQVDAINKQLNTLQSSLNTLFDSSNIDKTTIDKIQQQLNDLISKYQVSQDSIDNTLNTLHQQIQTITTKHSKQPSSYNGNIQSLIDRSIERYAADWTEEIDYALKSSGGQVIAHSPTHQPIAPFNNYNTISDKLLSYIRQPVYNSISQPEQIISTTMNVGECWPMNSNNGWIIIRLREPIIANKITIQHISSYIIPDNTTVPQSFNIYGIQDKYIKQAVLQHTNQQPVGDLLASFTYDRQGKQLQQFTLNNNNNTVYTAITVSVLSNYGNRYYTCLYRVRVHGQSVRHLQSNGVKPLYNQTNNV